MKHSLLGGLLTLALALFVYPVFAEEHESAMVLEEIVVTARKREENIQDTALSVSALSGADIADRFPSDIRDLAADSPSLLIDDLQTNTNDKSLYKREVNFKPKSDNTSEIALPNPPIMLCSSKETNNFVFNKFLITILSIGLMVCILITLQDIFFLANSSETLIPGDTIAPAQNITISFPSLKVIDSPILNL